MLVFLALGIAQSLTLSPWMDEGMFADVAFSFRNFGHLGSSVLDPYGYQELPGVHQYTYWQFPLYFMGLGIWFRIFPATVVWMRLFSVAWGYVFLASWFVIVRSLSRKDSLALLVASLIGLDYAVLVTASNGRMDMMCAALGLAGLASYFWFRDSNWSVGVVLAACFRNRLVVHASHGSCYERCDSRHGVAGLAAHQVGRHRRGQRALPHRDSLLSLLY